MTHEPVFRLLFLLLAFNPGIASAAEDRYGGLGLTVVPLYSQAPLDHLDALLVLAVLPGTSAEKEGLEKGDMITHLDGERIEGRDFETMILKKLREEAADAVKLTVKRGGPDGEALDFLVRRCR